ncbi:MAG: preprotein translocase subunit SecY [Fimbriimonadales bacterium]
MKLADTIRAAWQEPELRQRLLFIFAIFGVYAIALHIAVPVPGLSLETIKKLIEGNGYLNFMNMLGGGALKKLSVFALGLNPYITASIIMQLVKVAVPALKKEAMEGDQHSRQQMAKRTRVLTIILCIFQGIGLLTMIGAGGIPVFAKFQVICFWTAGAMMMLWLGEQIQDKGIGQGVSLMIFAGIVVSFPYIGEDLGRQISAGTVQAYQVILLVSAIVAMTALIVLFTLAQRRIHIHHMRRTVGGTTKQIGGSSTYLPIPVNAVGVIPIIFAMALIFIPAQFSTMLPAGSPIANFFSEISQFLSPRPSSVWYHWVVGSIAYSALIFFFTYFYTAIQFNVEDLASHLRRSGAYIPGVRQGKQTEQYLDGVISRITVVGALFLAVISLLPFWLPSLLGLGPQLQVIGGTSLLIIVSVVLDLMRQIESNLLMRGYQK